MTTYTNIKYIAVSGQNTCICVDIDDVTSFVPLDPANTDYRNIMELVEAGQLTIAPADQPE